MAAQGNEGGLEEKLDVLQRMLQTLGSEVAELKRPGPADAPSTPTTAPDEEQRVLHVFWDMANCSVTPDDSVVHLVKVLEERIMAACGLRRRPVRRGRFYYNRPGGDSRWGVPERQLSDLSDQGFTHVDPGTKRGADDMKLKDEVSDLLHDPSIDPSRCVVCIISGDRDFSNQLMTLQHRSFTTILIHNRHARGSFRSLASHTLLWEELKEEAAARVLGSDKSARAGGYRPTIRSADAAGAERQTARPTCVFGAAPAATSPSSRRGAERPAAAAPAVTWPPPPPVNINAAPAVDDDDSDMPVLEDGGHEVLVMPSSSDDADDAGPALTLPLLSWLARPFDAQPSGAVKDSIVAMKEELLQGIEGAKVAALAAADAAMSDPSVEPCLGEGQLRLLQYQSVLDGVVYPLFRSAASIANADNAHPILQALRRVVDAHRATKGRLQRLRGGRSVGIIAPWVWEGNGEFSDMVQAAADAGELLCSLSPDGFMEAADRDVAEALRDGSDRDMLQLIAGDFARVFLAMGTRCMRVPTERERLRCVRAIGNAVRLQQMPKDTLKSVVTTALDRIPRDPEMQRACCSLHLALHKEGVTGNTLAVAHFQKAVKRAVGARSQKEANGALDTALQLCQPVAEAVDLTVKGTTVLDTEMPRMRSAAEGCDDKSRYRMQYNFAVLQSRRSQFWLAPAVANRRVSGRNREPYVWSLKHIVQDMTPQQWESGGRALVEDCLQRPMPHQSADFTSKLLHRQAAALARDMIAFRRQADAQQYQQQGAGFWE
eukprot:TRINITY_DN39154_c0_g1_i1.p1 TRINITY_DN39154_c0_g1~~TRINITY_DN39154_c0_g1_i1.p1  ORF type:complete len:795 (+),score=294.07 TRINITY_DN39154_c0_g1_i1:69-2387(+)